MCPPRVPSSPFLCLFNYEDLSLACLKFVTWTQQLLKNQKNQKKPPTLENPRCEVDLKVLKPEAWQRCIPTSAAPCKERISPPRQEDAHLLHLVWASPTPAEGYSACTLHSSLVWVPVSGNPGNMLVGFPAGGRDPRRMAVSWGWGRAAGLSQVHGTQPAMYAVPLGLLP